MRELKIYKNRTITFYSWGQLITRVVSKADYEEAMELIEMDDDIAIDYFCSRLI